MSSRSSRRSREDALRRAEEHSPFLRQALQALPPVADAFLSRGAVAAVEFALAAEGENLEAELRRKRHGLAIAVALGDLAGELPLEDVTRLLSQFADSAIDRALEAAIRERVPDAEPTAVARSDADRAAAARGDLTL